MFGKTTEIAEKRYEKVLRRHQYTLHVGKLIQVTTQAASQPSVGLKIGRVIMHRLENCVLVST